MIFNIVLLFIIPFGALGFDKDFRAVNDRVPHEFMLLFDSLKLGIKNPSEKLKLVGIAKDLDDNLGLLAREHIFFLMKTEVIKNVLEYQHRKVRSFDVTTVLLERLEEDLKKKERYLTPFAQWIWRSILAELNHRKELGFITNKSFDPNAFEGVKRSEALRFSRYLKYLLPWIDKMDSLNTSEFNDFTKEVSWLILRRLNERSILFKRYATSATGDTKVTLFNIPQRLLELHPEEIKRMQSDETPLSLKEKSAKEKNEALKEVESVIPEDLSPLSEEVSKELEKKTQ